MGNHAARIVKHKYFNQKCYWCGKEFYAGGEYVFKRNWPAGHWKWFCSYTCVRDFDRFRAEQKEKQHNAER